MKKSLYVSLAVNLFLIFSFVGKRIYNKLKPSTQDMTFINYSDQARTSVHELFPIDSNDIVFVGTSLTEGFPMDEFFHDSSIRNRGISGNTVGHIHGRIYSILKAHPKKLFIEAGINDLNFGHSIASLIIDYYALLKFIKKEAPGTELYVQSILPVGGCFKNKTDSVIKANIRIESLCREFGAHYINLYRAFVKDGYLNDDYSVDGLHPNGAGYLAWKKEIEKYL